MRSHARHPSLVRKLPLTFARSALPLPRPLHHYDASVLELPLALSPCIRLLKRIARHRKNALATIKMTLIGKEGSRMVRVPSDESSTRLISACGLK
jgi:hypothetical protein